MTTMTTANATVKPRRFAPVSLPVMGDFDPDDFGPVLAVRPGAVSPRPRPVSPEAVEAVELEELARVAGHES